MKNPNKMDSRVPSMMEVKIGNYLIGETLGVGTFGKVKIGVHETTKVKVAVKIVNRDKIKKLDVAGKLRREIENLWLFRHPHIIKLYQVISTPTDIFMIMEYVSGGELFDHIVKTGKIGEKEGRRFFQQIISGVEYCHRHKVVHRDLKPENLLLDTKGNVKIGDFGLSNIMEDGEFLNTSCGSPNYAAPEVISGKLYAGPEVDVWSCGVILFALLCGTLPFDDSHLPTLFTKIKSGMFHIYSHLSDSVADLLRRMLEVDVVERITVEEIKKHPWFVVDLPNHLFPPERDEDASIIDKEAVVELSRICKVPEADVLNALIGNDPTDQLCVAYHLLIDNKRYGGGTSDVNMDEVNNFYVAADSDNFATSTILTGAAASSSTSYGGIRPQSTGGVGISSHGGGGSATLSGKDDGEGKVHPERMSESHGISRNLDPIVTVEGGGSLTNPKRSRWHLGIRSVSKPWEIMFEIFKALRDLDYEWKIINPYHVRVRKLNVLRGHYSKMVLQLYQVDNRNYLVDFKCADDAAPGPGNEVGGGGTTGSESESRLSASFNDPQSHNFFGADLDRITTSQIGRHQTMEFFEMCSQLITRLSR